MILLEADYAGVVILVLLVMFGVPIIIFIIGGLIRKKYKIVSNILFIIATIYLIVSLGFCGGMIN
jgi:hypothetical protein